MTLNASCTTAPPSTDKKKSSSIFLNKFRMITPKNFQRHQRRQQESKKKLSTEKPHSGSISNQSNVGCFGDGSVNNQPSPTPYVIALAMFGIMFIVVGLILYINVLHSFIHQIIAEKLVLAEGSETYEKWKQIPMPVYYRYYFFNVTNAQDIERHGARPQVREIGPFTYRSRWTKHPIIFHPNGTVTFRERKSLQFVPELSIASDRERMLVTVNGPLTVTLALLQKAPLVVRNIVSLGLSTVSEGFFVRRSARELLFDGYPEMLTSFGPLLNPNIPNTKGRFGWLYGRNNTDDGLFTVQTGRNDIRQINQIERYNGLNELQYWAPKSNCNQLKGATDGQIIATNGDRTFRLFHPELCRTIKFTAEEVGLGSEQFVPKQYAHLNGDIRFTVDRYVPDADTLSSMDDHAPNSCYLSKITPSKPELGDLLVSIRQRDRDGNDGRNGRSRFQIRPFFRTNKSGNRLIFRSGVFDMSECKYGAPVLFSYPHFLHAHPNYRENIGGLRPDRQRHQFHMMVEPTTGTSIRSYARIQINIYITKPPWISRFRYVPEVVFPVFWQELRAEASIDMIEQINWALTKPFIFADIFSMMLIGIGLALVALSAYFMMAINHKKQRHLQKTQSPSNNQKHTTQQMEMALNNNQQQRSPPQTAIVTPNVGDKKQNLSYMNPMVNNLVCDDEPKPTIMESTSNRMVKSPDLLNIEEVDEDDDDKEKPDVEHETYSK